MAKKHSAAQDEDTVLWQRVATGVTPLKARLEAEKMTALFASTAQEKAVVSAEPSRRPAALAAAVPLPVSPRPASIAMAPVDLRQGETAGIDNSTKRRLFRGEVPINRRLDLHGLTAARAQTRLESFIQQAAFDGCRCVLVITGKGAGILRGHVPGWLKRAPLAPLVLALAEARPSDGGGGAFYVLLRRRRSGSGR
jgi:DNA-nicking Smr family endonuclease